MLGDGVSYGYGYGSGYGSGAENGNGHGFGYGNGYGNGFGDGYYTGYTDGDGCGHGFYSFGNGDGRLSIILHGDERVTISDSRGECSGFLMFDGSGWGDSDEGDGCGNGIGCGYGDTYGDGEAFCEQGETDGC